MTSKNMLKFGMACLALLLVGKASALCVSAPEANLRNGPGTKYEKNWTVYKYMPLKRLARKGSWYQVRDVDGDKHWIHKNLVKANMHCAVVKASKANVRRGPGTRYRQVSWSPVERYYSFKVIKTKARWVKVKDEVSDSGWVAKSLLWIQ
ncbi:MAG: SH3 domain-containing protein [Georgfuchsia sp.]